MPYAELHKTDQENIEKLLGLPPEEQREILAQLIEWCWSDDIGTDLELALKKEA